MNTLVAQQLTELSPATCGAVLLAGLATSVSPCTLSVLPLTIGYIGGYTDTPSSSSSSSSSSSEGDPSGSLPADAASTSGRDSTSSSGSSSSSSSVGLQALCFSLGLASSLAGLGVAASGLGRAYGAIGPGLPTAVALVAILMGLNLLQVVQLPLPSFLQDVDVRTARLPPPLTAYLAGATFALAASPCSTPVLATILAYASTQASPGGGGLLLFLYSCGYVVPLLAAASATGAAKRLLDMRAYSAWVTPASGVLLVGGGTYALLSRLLPAL